MKLVATRAPDLIKTHCTRNSLSIQINLLLPLFISNFTGQSVYEFFTPALIAHFKHNTTNAN
jgi:hypothetical protein